MGLFHNKTIDMKQFDGLYNNHPEDPQPPFTWSRTEFDLETYVKPRPIL